MSNEPSNRPEHDLSGPLPTSITPLSDGRYMVEPLDVIEMRRRLVQAADLIQRLSTTVKAQEETIVQLRAKYEPVGKMSANELQKLFPKRRVRQ